MTLQDPPWPPVLPEEAASLAATVAGSVLLPGDAGYDHERAVFNLNHELVPAVIVVLGYGVSFYMLSLTLKSIPVGLVYAIWSGVGIVLITLVALVMYRQVPDLPAVAGLGLIVAGVVVLKVFSKMQTH